MLRQLAFSPGFTRNGTTSRTLRSTSVEAGSSSPNCDRPSLVLRSRRIGTSVSATSSNPPFPDNRSGVSTAGFRCPAAIATIRNVAAAISAVENRLRVRCRAALRKPNRTAPATPRPPTANPRSESIQPPSASSPPARESIPAKKKTNVAIDSPAVASRSGISRNSTAPLSTAASSQQASPHRRDRRERDASDSLDKLAVVRPASRSRGATRVNPRNPDSIATMATPIPTATPPSRAVGVTCTSRNRVPIAPTHQVFRPCTISRA